MRDLAKILPCLSNGIGAENDPSGGGQHEGQQHLSGFFQGGQRFAFRHLIQILPVLTH